MRRGNIYVCIFCLQNHKSFKIINIEKIYTLRILYIYIFLLLKCLQNMIDVLNKYLCEIYKSIIYVFIYIYIYI